MPGMFAWCSKTLRSMWNLSMWYMFFLRVSRYRDADRVESAATCRPGVRRRFVSSKIFTFAPTQIARTPQSNPKLTLFLALRTFRAWRLIELLLHERSLAHLACEYPRCIIYDIIYFCSRGVSGSTFSFKLSILLDAHFNTFYILFDRVRWDWN